MKERNGVYPAIVVDNVDPANSGRVKVRLPQVLVAGESGHEVWARMATLMAGANRGTWFIPEVNDEVLIAFEQSDPNRPYVLGGLWNTANPPPEKMDLNNNKKLVRSRNGVQITLDDQGGRESITIETPGGQKLTLEDGPGAVVLTDSNGNSVELKTNGITVNAASNVILNASAVEVNAGLVSVSATVSKFSGVVQCDTLISNSVVSQSYTPGAGNIW
ncbi:MAG TPA: phage baseplate assembly protein V [Casimicrobiaceae bacterium]|nr:phage baseplate assembly protein V [Casimicrobiaceae bacterium]